MSDDGVVGPPSTFDLKEQRERARERRERQERLQKQYADIRGAALGDPLREVTRKNRRSLLGVSLIALVVSEAGLLPQKIEALGLSFDDINHAALLNIGAAVILYFLMTFTFYGLTDFLYNRIAIRTAIYNIRVAIEEREKEDYELPPVKPMSFRYSMAYWARILLDFVVPVLIGVFAMYNLMVTEITPLATLPANTL